jgi:hypothetical protein
LLATVVRRAGTPEEDVLRLAREFRETIASLPVKSSFDYLGAIFILTRLITTVEKACERLRAPMRTGVVFGVSQLAGVIASQMPVLKTDASIIEVTLPFITFCDLISKLMAHTLPLKVSAQGMARLNMDRSAILARIASQQRSCKDG